jgi:hypothetical protein
MNAYELAYEYVQHTNCCIFLTGKAGTGKTTFLRRLKQECSKQMAVVAPTGVAAINAEGVTIHSLFQLPPQVFLPTQEARKQLFSEMQMRAQKQRVLRNLELLVIDEVSMVRSDLLDTIDAVLRHIKHRPNHPFGGVQVLFIGDLFQLSPVAREQEWRLMQPYYEGAYFFQAQVFRELHPVYIELDHVFRQTNSDFIEILNQVRNNALTSQTLQYLNNRYCPDFEPSKQKEHYITLSTHNSKVDAINLREMEALKGKAYTYQAKVKDTFPESMFPMDMALTLKVGARVMFVKNDSSQEKLYYNGKLGVVTSLSKDAINVTCEDGTKVDVHTETWENVRYTADTGSDTIITEVIGTFSHYPLRLAWAITIHKAQGLTFDRVVIDAADAFAAGQVYVALSRCRTLGGIVLHTPIPSRALTNAREVLYFTKNQSDIQSVETRLPAAKTEYMSILLCSLYDFRSLINRFAALSRVVKNMDSVQGDVSKFFISCIGGLEGLQVIAERFQQQLRQIIYHNQSTINTQLENRLTAACGYFLPKLQMLLTRIEACPLRTNDRSDASYIKQNIIDLYADLARVIYMMEHVAAQPDNLIKTYFKVRQNFKLVEPKLVVHSAHRKVRSDSTAFKTLELFYAGFTITEIAKKRKITIRTVVKHLRVFIEQDVIHISNFTPTDQQILES